MGSITLPASKSTVEGSVSLPLSKSISNRGLIISALSGGLVENEKLSHADDTLMLQRLLDQIAQAENTVINCGNAGTVFRFLTAYLSITPGEWTLKGDDRMNLRPIGSLVDSLRIIEAEIEYLGEQEFPPLKIKGKPLSGGLTTIGAFISSQFISAMMMIGPMLPDGLRLTCIGNNVSTPYIYLTARLMRSAGAEVALDLPEIKIKGNGYKECIIPYETDWSSAAFWYELLALAEDGELFLPGLKEDSFQGDWLVKKYFYLFGIDTSFDSEGALIKKHDWLAEGFNFDITGNPDLAPAMILATAGKGFGGNFYGVAGLRNKESDRTQALANELAKCGVICTLEPDFLSFKAQKLKISEAIDTYNDHRIAMAFAPLAVLGEPITINNPEVVSKSYPEFWTELHKVLG